MSELARWDAVETLEQIGAGQITRAEVLDAAIARAEAHELDAIVTETYARARRIKPKGPLAGVPSFVKDLAQMKGVRTTWGSPGAGTYISKASDAFVTRFEQTGLISLGKSATPEFGLTATTEFADRPPCRNPWNPAHSTGGSSGGAGALVASGVVPLAHASDGGGSIRIPASCCGLVGLKVSRRRFDMEASHLLPVNIAVHGCVSRTVRDTQAFWSAMQPSAYWHRPAKISRRLRIALFTRPRSGTPVHEDNVQAAEAAGRLCESLGHSVEEIESPLPGRFHHDFTLYWALIAAVQVRGGKLMVHRGFDPDRVEPWSRGLSDLGTSKPLEVARAILRLRGDRKRYERALQGFDVLLCPTLAAPPPPLGFLGTGQDFDTKLARLLDYTPFTAMQNVVGAPAISLPLARSATGLPLGVQFASTHGDEATLLRLAIELEQAQPWSYPHLD